MSNSAEIVLRAVVAAATVIATAYLGFEAVCWLARRYAGRYPGVVKIVERAHKPVRVLAGLIAAQIVSVRIAHRSEGWIDTVDHALRIAIIATLIWLAVNAVSVVEDQVLKKRQ